MYRRRAREDDFVIDADMSADPVEDIPDDEDDEAMPPARATDPRAFQYERDDEKEEEEDEEGDEQANANLLERIGFIAAPHYVNRLHCTQEVYDLIQALGNEISLSSATIDANTGSIFETNVVDRQPTRYIGVDRVVLRVFETLQRNVPAANWVRALDDQPTARSTIASLANVSVHQKRLVYARVFFENTRMPNAEGARTLIAWVGDDTAPVEYQPVQATTTGRIAESNIWVHNEAKMVSKKSSVWERCMLDGNLFAPVFNKFLGGETEEEKEAADRASLAFSLMDASFAINTVHQLEIKRRVSGEDLAVQAERHVSRFEAQRTAIIRQHIQRYFPPPLHAECRFFPRGFTSVVCTAPADMRHVSSSTAFPFVCGLEISNRVDRDAFDTKSILEAAVWNTHIGLQTYGGVQVYHRVILENRLRKLTLKGGCGDKKQGIMSPHPLRRLLDFAHSLEELVIAPGLMAHPRLKRGCLSGKFKTRQELPHTIDPYEFLLVSVNVPSEDDRVEEPVFGCLPASLKRLVLCAFGEKVAHSRALARLLRTVPNLRSLEMPAIHRFADAQWQGTPELLAAIGEMSQLETLKLYSIALNQQQTGLLAESVSRLARLRHLDLETPFDEAPLEPVEEVVYALERNPSIISLNISGRTLRDAERPQPVGQERRLEKAISGFRCLETLDLTKTADDDRNSLCGRIAQVVRPLRNLRKLSCNVPGAVATNLFQNVFPKLEIQEIRLNVVRALHAGGDSTEIVSFHDAGNLAAAWLRNVRSLRIEADPGVKLSLVGPVQLSVAVNLRDLSIQVHATPFDAIQAHAFFVQLARCQQLSSLRLINVLPFDDKAFDFDSLTDALERLRSLKEFVFQEELNDEESVSLFETLRLWCNNLERLELDVGPINQDGGRMLANLVTHEERLRSFSLADARMRSGGPNHGPRKWWRVLITALRGRPGLEELRLVEAFHQHEVFFIEDDVNRFALRGLAQIPALQYLDLSSTPFSDEECDALFIPLLTHPSLQDLKIKGYKLDAQRYPRWSGVQHLVEMFRHGRLVRFESADEIVEAPTQVRERFPEVCSVVVGRGLETQYFARF